MAENMITLKSEKGATGSGSARGTSSIRDPSSSSDVVLSDRWEQTCTRDVNGRPVLLIRDCKEPEDFAVALRKLYGRAPGDPEKCPVHRFSGFEDALRCLKPADQLCLSSVLPSALAYLESIPWTVVQAEQVSEALTKISAVDCAQKLLDRTPPSPEKVCTTLLDELLEGATDPSEPIVCKGARLFMAEVMELNASCLGKEDAADAFAACIRRSLLQLAEGIENLQFETKFLYRNGTQRRIYEHNTKLSALVGSLAWMFQLPQQPGEMDFRGDVVEVMVLLWAKCESELYETRIFHEYIAEPLYAPVIKAVAEGSLLISAELRTKLLRMWVPVKLADAVASDITSAQSKSIQTAFSAVLSTVPSELQVDILQDLLSNLMDADPWEPWFKEWMTKHLVEERMIQADTEK